MPLWAFPDSEGDFWSEIRRRMTHTVSMITARVMHPANYGYDVLIGNEIEELELTIDHEYSDYEHDERLWATHPQTDTSGCTGDIDSGDIQVPRVSAANENIGHDSCHGQGRARRSRDHDERRKDLVPSHDRQDMNFRRAWKIDHILV